MKAPALSLNCEAHGGLFFGKSRKTRHIFCLWSLLDSYAATRNQPCPVLDLDTVLGNTGPHSLGMMIGQAGGLWDPALCFP